MDRKINPQNLCDVTGFFLAKDYNGRWSFYEFEPKKDGLSWNAEKGQCLPVTFNIDFDGSWEESLFKPKNDVSQEDMEDLFEGCILNQAIVSDVELADYKTVPPEEVCNLYNQGYRFIGNAFWGKTQALQPMVKFK